LDASVSSIKGSVVHIGPGYIHDIEDWPRLKNKKEVERLLGLINYQSAFIEEYTQILSKDQDIV
jgi:hypothetical protein